MEALPLQSTAPLTPPRSLSHRRRRPFKTESLTGAGLIHREAVKEGSGRLGRGSAEPGPKGGVSSAKRI